MTFDELVNVTQAELAAKAKRKMIPRETVQRILEEAGLIELMQQAASINPSRRLLLRQVYFKGNKWLSGENLFVPFTYRRSLKPGLNGWVGGNSTGKSTILKIIAWALSGEEPNFKADVRAWLEEVAVEFEIVGEGIFTIHYYTSIDKSKITGYIFANDIDSVLQSQTGLVAIEAFIGKEVMAQAIARFFSLRLGFSPLEWVQSKNYSLHLTQGAISWGVYAQAMFIGADDYADFMFPTRSMNGKHHQKTLGMYLGLDLLEAVSKVQTRYEQARRDYMFERERVRVNAAGVRQQIEELESELREVERHIQNIDAGHSILVNLTHVNELRTQVARCVSRVAALTDSEQEELEAERRIQYELQVAERIHQDLNESIQFKLFLSGLEVERCPHCENTIPQIRVTQELETKTCRVCHSELRPSIGTDQQSAHLKDLEDKIRRLKSLLRETKKKTKWIRTDLTVAQQELERYKAEMDDLSRQAQTGFTTEMRKLIERQGYLRGQLAQLEGQTEEAQSERLEELKNRQKVLETALHQLRVGIAQRHENILGRLEYLTTDLVQKFGVRNVEEIWFEKNRFTMMVRQSGKKDRFAEMEPGEQLRLKIAFHLALLTLRINDDVGRHPALLIIDAPGSAEIDKVHFEAVLEGFTEIQAQFQDQVQILIASTKEELIEVCGEDRIEERQNEPLF